MPTIPQSPVSVNGIFASDSNLSTTDITTNNVTSTKHGLAPKTPGDAAQFLNGAATAAFAAVKDSDLSVSDITTNNATSSAHGFMPKSTMAAWAAWTPTYTNLTVGNGTHASSYIQIGKTVIARLSFTFGTTSSMGSGPIFSLPVTAVSSGYTNGQWLGAVRFVAGAAGFTGYIQYASTTTATLVSVGTSAATASDVTVTSTVPGTWTTGNTITGTLIYEAA